MRDTTGQVRAEGREGTCGGYLERLRWQGGATHFASASLLLLRTLCTCTAQVQVQGQVLHVHTRSGPWFRTPGASLEHSSTSMRQDVKDSLYCTWTVHVLRRVVPVPPCTAPLGIGTGGGHRGEEMKRGEREENGQRLTEKATMSGRPGDLQELATYFLANCYYHDQPILFCGFLFRVCSLFVVGD